MIDQLSKLESTTLLSQEETVKLMRVSRSWLWRNRKSQDNCIPHHYIGQRIFYQVKDLIDWVANQRK